MRRRKPGPAAPLAPGVTRSAARRCMRSVRAGGVDTTGPLVMRYRPDSVANRTIEDLAAEVSQR